MNDIEQLSQTPISRRRFVQGSAVAGISAFLAACTTGATSSPSASQASSSASASASATAEPSASASATPESTEVVGPLNFANWDAYIDLTTVPGPDGEMDTDDDEYDLPSPTLDDFKAEYGIEVNYANAEIEDNETFMATIRPQLENDVDTGWDLIVLTDWMAAKVVEAGWAEKINPAMIPDVVANIRDELKGLPWDPNFEYHVPWQSGATGVGYNIQEAGRELTKIADLFDPAFSGKVTLLSETRDTFPLIHLLLQARGEGSQNSAEEMTADDAQKVHDFLKPFVDSGHVRDFTGNEYLEDFAGGDTAAAMVWSGDLASSGDENTAFAYPEEGSMIWTDNMIIPKGAQHKAAAEAMMNFVYDVDRAARLANFIYYISPVKGVSEAIVSLDEEAGENPLLFPPADVVAKQHPQPNWDEATEEKVNELYADLSGV
jgi:spermidine/putrescine transport system substrate-binding protein